MIDVRGQRVSATDRLYLLETMPTLIVWGERDNTIPLEHGRRAHEAIPGSRLRDAAPRPRTSRTWKTPTGSPRLLREFIAETEPGADRGRRLGRRARAPLAALAPLGDAAA